MLLEARKIIQRLPSRGYQAAPRRFLLDEKLAFPEKIEIAALLFRQIDAMLEASDAPPGDAEKLEKFVVKSLRIARSYWAPFQSSANFAARALISFQSRRMGGVESDALATLYRKSHAWSRRRFGNRPVQKRPSARRRDHRRWRLALALFLR
jgi:hypothetical protein